MNVNTSPSPTSPTLVSNNTPLGGGLLKTPPPSFRFSVPISEMKNNSFDYVDLMKAMIQEQNKEKINSSFYHPTGASSSHNNLRESFEIEKELSSMAAPKNRLTEVIDRIEQGFYSDDDNDSNRYDSEDSFIDDHEEIDFDEGLETDHGGFFITKGDISHKEFDDDDYDDDQYNDDDNNGTEHRRHKKSSSSSSSSSSKKRKGDDHSSSSSHSKKKSKSSSSSSKEKVLVDIESPEIEELIQKLCNEISQLKNTYTDIKLLPKSIGPLLAKLYDIVRRTNTQGFVPTSILSRISQAWGVKEKNYKESYEESMG